MSSLDEIKFQLYVLQRRIYKCAIDIEQIFNNMLTGELKGRRADSESIQKTVDTMKKNDNMIAQFTTMMDQKHRDARTIIGMAISVATRHYHFSSTSKTPKITADYTFWKNIFQTLCRNVYIRPEIYTNFEGSLPLSDVIRIIEGILDAAVYDEIPLHLSAARGSSPVHSPRNHHYHRREHKERSYKEKSSKPKRQEKKSVLSSVISEGSDTGINSEYTEMTEAAETKNRKTGAMSPVGSSSILTHTQDGKMDIVIPGHDKRK